MRMGSWPSAWSKHDPEATEIAWKREQPVPRALYALGDPPPAMSFSKRGFPLSERK